MSCGIPKRNIMYRISQVSKETGVPQSTIRAYERLGFIEHVKRSEGGYREFNQRHIVQIKICRLVFKQFISHEVRRASYRIIKSAVAWDVVQCRLDIEDYIGLLKNEIEKTNQVLDILQNWDKHPQNQTASYTAQQAAEKVGITKGTVRNWQRNGLVKSFAKYEKRLYTENDIQRMKIIYMLRKIGYSLNILLSFFTAFDQDSKNAMQILIDPEQNEDINEAADRRLQILMSALEDGLEMLDITKERMKWKNL